MEQISWSEAFAIIAFLIGLFGTIWKMIDSSRPLLTNKDITRIANEVLEQLRKQT